METHLAEARACWHVTLQQEHTRLRGPAYCLGSPNAMTFSKMIPFSISVSAVGIRKVVRKGKRTDCFTKYLGEIGTL